MIYTASVNKLWNLREDLLIPHKRARLKLFYPAFEEVIEKAHSGHKYTESEAATTDYWRYIQGYHRSWRAEPLGYQARRQLCRKFFSGIKLYENIRDNGMLTPLTLHNNNLNLCLYAGYRRLVILHVLGIPTATYYIVDKS